MSTRATQRTTVLLRNHGLARGSQHNSTLLAPPLQHPAPTLCVGKIPVYSQGVRIGVLSSGFPAWAFLPPNILGGSLSGVVLPISCKACHFAISRSTHKIFQDDESTFLNTLPSHPVEMLIFDGTCRPPRGSNEFWSILPESVIYVLTGQSPRNPLPTEWTTSSTFLDHQQFGGVTSWTGGFHVLSQAHASSFDWSTVQLKFAQPSLLSNLIDRRISGRKTQEKQAEVQSVGFSELQKGTTSFVLPTIFGNQTCLRRLEPREQTVCADVPTTISHGWTDEMHIAVLKHLTAPVKILDAIAHALRLNVERRTLLTPNCNKKNKAPGEEAGPPCKRIRVESSQSQAVNVSTLSWVAQSIIRMKYFSLLDYKVKTTAAEKATKRDDAEVPEHLWNYRIDYLFGFKALDSTQQKALDLLRTTMLQRWKRNVVNSWRKWWSTARTSVRD